MSSVTIVENSTGFAIRVKPVDMTEDFSNIQAANLRVLHIDSNTLSIWPCTTDADNEVIVHVVLPDDPILSGKYKAELYIEAGPFKGVVGDPFSFKVRKLLSAT